MSTMYETAYPQFNGYGEVTNDNAQYEVIAAKTPDLVAPLRTYIEKLNISIYKAASDTNGVLQVLNTDGDVIHTMNAGDLKDISLDWSPHGIYAGDNVGIQIVVSGGGTYNASASVVIKGHYKFREHGAD